MEVFQVTGGTPLYGSVRIGGAKNASYKLMIASLLAKDESRLLNFSKISDVEMVAQIIEKLGAKIKRAGERAIFINPDSLHSFDLSHDDGEQGRFSTMFIPVLVAKFGQAIVPLPGGDKIGKRPLERHFEGLSSLGITLKEENGLVYATSNGLIGARYRFSKNTHTGTETLLMAAVLATGTTIIENAAEEPEVDDLIAFLNEMGAKVTRKEPRVIEVQGVKELHGAIHKIIPDRNEAVSYACAALVTKGDVIIENAKAEHLHAFLDALDQIGAGYEVGNYGIRFFYQGELRATNITTQVAPGFMTDWQPLLATVLTQCQGESILHETIMQNRFAYVEALTEMGAQIEPIQLSISNPESFYNFNLTDEQDQAYHAIKITGPRQLRSGRFRVHDLRHGATLILAALSAVGTSTISGVEQVDRGYEALAARLQSMGAKIERVNNQDLV
ncbi:MAG: UDP-N-acetylglucosamine 1-carboxyvinyltransferase [Candidatus Pacebacteria bacterium CG_4_10_14_0_8_um_filter_43_12]|nr:MAG: UDP-N-acetylglucosamine 1-carboxyvinyltransferase [Candidatus Pacebacteria bacterium CG_4_10_14_0_8_um_filter_43_12]